jgi:RNA polymerase sigma-70 factor (ECF subfamily)
MEYEPDSVSDEALVEAMQQGDRGAGACLYHRHIDRVHRICYRIVLDRSQVADCVQEVWVKVFRQAHRFHCDRSFASWLNRVATNTAIDHYRKHRRRGRHRGIDEVPDETLPVQDPTEDKQMDQAHWQQRIQEALQDITVKQRTAFTLRYLEGMPPPQIAEILGCQPGTVRTHIQRCLVALRRKLTSDTDSFEV